MKSLITATYHQCNIFRNHFTYSPFTSSQSPSMTITIYHQHHYHHYYHHGLCHHSFHPAMNHPLLHALCPLFVSLCDSVQTHSIIVPAKAVWHPDQLHFDDAWAFLALQLQLMASTNKGEQCHGGYPGNRNVRYASHSMADTQGTKSRHVYFSIKTAFNKMIKFNSSMWPFWLRCDVQTNHTWSKFDLLMSKKSTCGP